MVLNYHFILVPLVYMANSWLSHRNSLPRTGILELKSYQSNHVLYSCLILEGGDVSWLTYKANGCNEKVLAEYIFFLRMWELPGCWTGQRVCLKTWSPQKRIRQWLWPLSLTQRRRGQHHLPQGTVHLSMRPLPTVLSISSSVWSWRRKRPPFQRRELQVARA